MSITIDIIDGSQARKNTEGWQEVTRIATITGLTQTGQSQFNEALGASGMPAFGSRHPSISAVYLDEVNMTSPGPGSVQATLTYRRRQLPDYPMGGAPAGEAQVTVEVGTTLQQIEATLDWSKVETTLTYTGNKKPANDEKDQIASFPRMVPQTTITVKRRETGSPLAKSKEYVGYVNGSAWNADPDSGAETWLCTGITGSSSDSNQTYDVTYSFQHCGDSPLGTWWTKVYWRGSDGKIPDDLIGGTGIKSIKVYALRDFNALNL